MTEDRPPFNCVVEGDIWNYIYLDLNLDLLGFRGAGCGGRVGSKCASEGGGWGRILLVCSGARRRRLDFRLCVRGKEQKKGTKY